MKRMHLLLVLILAFLCLDIVPTIAQSAITVSQDQIISGFPNGLTFQLSAASSTDIQKITLMYRTNGATCQSAIAQQVIDFTAAASVEVEWEWDFTRTGILPPGAEVYWQWQVEDAAGNILLTQEQTYLVSDTRRTWDTLTSGQVTLQWYQGNAAFGQSMMDIANQSLERLAQNAGVRPTGQVWINIYPTPEDVQEVDIHVSEWAGGVTYPEYNSTILAVAPGEMDWAEQVIPHELAHMVTEALVFNCRGIWLPTWLSEGLAMYAQGELPQVYVDMVNSALEGGTLPPLRTLESGFSSDSEAASLSYGQSGMVVTYLIDQYGAQKMADLLAAIQAGQLADEALRTVYGLDTDGLDAEWRISLGYEPQPTRAATSGARTAVPTLALWTSAVRPTGTATASPNPSPTAIPTDTPQPLPSPTIQAPPTTQADPTPGRSRGIVLAALVAIILGFLILLAIAGTVLFIVLRRRRKSS